MGQERQPDHPPGGVTASEGRKILIAEADALLARLQQVQPFEWTMPMATAAAPSTEALRKIHWLIKTGRDQLRKRVHQFSRMMKYDRSKPFDKCPAAYSILKLQFNSLLDQFDIFADVVNQRSEHDTGIWIAGLDIFARDALRLNGDYYEA